MSIRRRAPRPLSAALIGLRDRLSPGTVLADVQAVWKQAVGDVIAAESRVVSERSGTLTVVCSSAAWMAELDGDSLVILERLNALVDSGVLTRLRCVVGVVESRR